MVDFAEYKGKSLFSQYGIPVTEGILVRTERELEEIVHDYALSSFPQGIVIKSQVLTGHRGQEGGVKIILPVKGQEEEVIEIKDSVVVKVRPDALESMVNKYSHDIFRKEIGGQLPHGILLEPALSIAEEMYLSLTYGRDETTGKSGLILLFSPIGGMDINELAKLGHVQKIPLDISKLRGEHYLFSELSEKLNYKDYHGKLDIIQIAESLVRLYQDTDATLLEINPLFKLKDGKIIAGDAKVSFDDASKFRQAIRFANWRSEWWAGYDKPEASLSDLASRRDMSYVSLGGDIACMANGAGLGMATIDLVTQFGGTPANFLDIGGNANQENIEVGLGYLLKTNPKGILINVFGGIVDTTEVARAIVSQYSKIKDVPLAIRISGRNSQKAIKILEEAGIKGASTKIDIDLLRKVIPDLKPVYDSLSLPDNLELKQKPMEALLADGFASPISESGEVAVIGLGKKGIIHLEKMLNSGTNIVAGVHGKEGSDDGKKSIEDITNYKTVSQMFKEHPNIETGVVFVPNKQALEEITKTIELGSKEYNLKKLVLITEWITKLDMEKIYATAQKAGVRIIGPNSPGTWSPIINSGVLGIIPYAELTQDYIEGSPRVAVVSRSGTQLYDVARNVLDAGYNLSHMVGIGGDWRRGTSMLDAYKALVDDPNTDMIVVIGEVGGYAEQELADYVAKNGMYKPIVSFIGGKNAPEGERMGHAGAIAEEGTGYDTKAARMAEAKIPLVELTTQIPGMLDLYKPLLKY